MSTNPPSPLDILQIEDSQCTYEGAASAARKLGLQYLNVTTLNDLKRALEKGTNARIYLVDGKFPEENGGAITFNGDKAVRLIREKVGSDALIILLSGEMNIRSIAQNLNVEFIQKGDDAIQDIITRLKERLDS
jgi:phosphoribosylanthranilate isomerase